MAIVDSHQSVSVPVEERDLDQKENEVIESFMNDGCGCKEKCSSMFDAATSLRIRAECAELTRSELDLFVMGQLMSVTHDGEEIRLNSGHQPQSRQRTRGTYMHKGRKVINNFKCMY